MIVESKLPKTVLARELGVSRGSLYYRPKLPERDWALKVQIEEVLRIHPAYGHKRLAIALNLNKKRHPAGNETLRYQTTSSERQEVAQTEGEIRYLPKPPHGVPPRVREPYLGS